MRRTRVLCVIGTRPEAIKLAPVVWAIQSSERLESRVCVTGQHGELLDSALLLYRIEPHHHLGLFAPGQGIHEVHSRILVGMREVLELERPDIVLVQGDTTTALAAALSAFYAGIPVGHVEAGLRTGCLDQPWPEEAHRALIDRLATWHFAPTARARDALLNEGIRSEGISVVGNTAIDALLWLRDQLTRRPWEEDADALGPIRFLFERDREALVILVTTHRRENLGDGLRNICSALRELSVRHRDAHIVFPIHPNPDVERPVRSAFSGRDNLHVLRPLGHAAFARLLGRCSVVLTDSGGVQEEAPSLGKPVLVLRDVTDRPEAVEAGTARLVGTDVTRIVTECSLLLDNAAVRESMSRAHAPYGDGRASRRIADGLTRAFAGERA